MREKSAALAIILFTLVFFTSNAFAADVAKIGVFDFQKFFESSSAGKTAQEKLGEQGRKMEEELMKKGAEIEELQKKLEREALVMSKEMREQKERDIRIKKNDFRTLQKKFRSDFKNLQEDLVKKMQVEVRKIVEKIGEKQGYLLIVERVGVLYYPNQIDITDEVIKAYNKENAQKAKKK